MQDMRTVKQSINVCHPRQDLRDESHLLSLERSNSISRVGSIVNPKYRFFRKMRRLLLSAKEVITSDALIFIHKNAGNGGDTE